ncbi:Prolyl 4-hydroxylase 1 [Bienertia sinuspersici]
MLKEVKHISLCSGVVLFAIAGSHEGRTYKASTMLVMQLNVHIQPCETEVEMLIVDKSMLKAGSGECSCGGTTVSGLSVKPLKGDAVLFWSMGLDGQPDPRSVHGGCEVISGEKWSATKWMRQKAIS